jgi:hypothetical protein
LFKLKSASHEEWRTYLSSLEQTNGFPSGPEGYLMALATCYRAYKADFSLREALFPWEKNIKEPSATDTPNFPATTL